MRHCSHAHLSQCDEEAMSCPLPPGGETLYQSLRGVLQAGGHLPSTAASLSVACVVTRLRNSRCGTCGVRQ